MATNWQKIAGSQLPRITPSNLEKRFRQWINSEVTGEEVWTSPFHMYTADALRAGIAMYLAERDPSNEAIRHVLPLADEVAGIDLQGRDAVAAGLDVESREMRIALALLLVARDAVLQGAYRPSSLERFRQRLVATDQEISERALRKVEPLLPKIAVAAFQVDDVLPEEFDAPNTIHIFGLSADNRSVEGLSREAGPEDVIVTSDNPIGWIAGGHQVAIVEGDGTVVQYGGGSGVSQFAVVRGGGSVVQAGGSVTGGLRPRERRPRKLEQLDRSGDRGDVTVRVQGTGSDTRWSYTSEDTQTGPFRLGRNTTLTITGVNHAEVTVISESPIGLNMADSNFGQLVLRGQFRDVHAPSMSHGGVRIDESSSVESVDVSGGRHSQYAIRGVTGDVVATDLSHSPVDIEGTAMRSVDISNGLHGRARVVGSADQFTNEGSSHTPVFIDLDTPDGTIQMQSGGLGRADD